MINYHFNDDEPFTLDRRIFVEGGDWRGKISVKIPTDHLLFDCTIGGMEYPFSMAIGMKLIYLGISANSDLINWVGDVLTDDDDWHGREVRFSIHNGSIWWSVWSTPMESHHDDPWWERGNFSPSKLIFGKRQSERSEERTKDATIPMPEGEYDATIKRQTLTKSWPRWPFDQTEEMVSVDIPEGIPVPGKGTAEYNVGPDALFSVGCPRGASDAEAIANVVQSALRIRDKMNVPRDYEKREKL